MSSILAELRAAAEPYKSFPKAVAAVVRAAFDRGATKVKVRFQSNDTDAEINLWVEDNSPRWTKNEWSEIVDLVDAATRPFPTNIGLTYVHHANILSVDSGARKEYVQLNDGSVNIVPINIGSYSGPNMIGFICLGTGEGVNARQDRSARRLVRELPRLLSPREAVATTVVDETGKTFTLVKELHEISVNGYTVSSPERMMSYGTDGLVLKYGAVRVPIGVFLSKVHLDNEQHEQIRILAHPWANGVIEITPVGDKVTVPVPTEAANDFEVAYYSFRGGGATSLAKALLAANIPGLVIQQMNKLVTSAMRDFNSSDHEFLLGEHRFTITCAKPSEIYYGAGRLLFRDPLPSAGGVTNLLLDVTNPVFRTVDSIYNEIMMVIWWQLAMWIQFHNNEIFASEPDAMVRTNMIYLALRRENSERTWDDE